MGRYLACKVNLRHPNVFQNAPGESNGLFLIGICIRVVNLVVSAIHRLTKVTGLDDDAPEGEDIAASLVGGTNPNGLVAEVEDQGPVVQRLGGLAVDMLGVDLEVGRSGDVPAMEGEVCSWFFYICYVWVHGGLVCDELSSRVAAPTFMELRNCCFQHG